MAYFFVPNMTMFKKVSSLRFILFPVISIFIFSSTLYGMEYKYLRVPLLFNNSKEYKKHKDDLAYITPYDIKRHYPDGKEIVTKGGNSIFSPKNPDRVIDEAEARRITEHIRFHDSLQARIEVEDDSAMMYIAGDVLTSIMDAAQFSFNIGLATGGTTEALRKLLGLSGMLYKIYGRTLDADKIERICTLDNYYFKNYLRRNGYSEEDTEKILAVSSYESEQLYMFIENLMAGDVRPGLFIAPRGHTNLEWSGETERFRKLVLRYFYLQLWQLHGIGSNSHDAFNEVYMRVKRDTASITFELYNDRRVKKALLKDGTDISKLGLEKIPSFKKIPDHFSRMGINRPTHASLISFIIQIQNAGHFIPKRPHPFFLKYMADNSIYDLDELIIAILGSTQDMLCKYTNNPKYHFRDIQEFVDELNYLLKEYDNVPMETITKGTSDSIRGNSQKLPDGSYPLQLFMASAVHKQLAVLRALMPPSGWSTASAVLYRAKAALLIATEESLGMVLDSGMRKTFFKVRPENTYADLSRAEIIEKKWSQTKPAKRINSILGKSTLLNSSL